jgi:uncharacterized membrane protein YagU involved in acid resistance
MNRTVRSMLIGAASGFAATMPMSAVMLAGRPLFARSQRRLPPTEITWNLAKKAGMDDVLRHPDRPRAHAVTTISHFGYGTIAGTIFPPVAMRLPGPRVGKGMLFGLLVWTASYLGWLPATDVRHSSLRDAPTRNLVMIAAHVVWGGTLGWLSATAERLASGRARSISSGLRARDSRSAVRAR